MSQGQGFPTQRQCQPEHHVVHQSNVDVILRLCHYHIDSTVCGSYLEGAKAHNVLGFALGFGSMGDRLGPAI